MPWKESSIMDERTKFISKLLQGEKMTHVCEEFNISRKTGHKLWNRYQAKGAVGLEEKSRAPHRRVRLTPPLVEKGESVTYVFGKKRNPCFRLHIKTKRTENTTLFIPLAYIAIFFKMNVMSKKEEKISPRAKPVNKDK